MQPTPTNRILILRSEASLAMGWVLQLFECAKDEQGRNARWKAWEGGWPGPKGLKNVVSHPSEEYGPSAQALMSFVSLSLQGPLVPDLTNSSLSVELPFSPLPSAPLTSVNSQLSKDCKANQGGVCSHRRLQDGLGRGDQSQLSLRLLAFHLFRLTFFSIQLRISHSDDTHPPFIVRLSAVSPERAAEQGFEFLRVVRPTSLILPGSTFSWASPTDRAPLSTRGRNSGNQLERLRRV